MSKVRIQREYKKLAETPPPGITCVTKDDNFKVLEISIIGAAGSPYENGVFHVELHLSDKYPFEPPRMNFVTPIYHPNVDTAGRICLDLLKMPPKGSWKPTITLEGLLIALQSLMTNPNPEDPLMVNIAEEYKYNLPEFNKKAMEWTRLHASSNSSTSNIVEVKENHNFLNAANV
ncbi:unnamed protein product [Bemisia tabaci]|uniref:Ubiquitin-conjugating enzyme E2 T n=1 Tax=Bemisia tabaci TaxID=7038 RepID=A0A9P0F567_BEMTA|nr:PREDICTED: ubiquitin-conjugating enzyme E2 T-like [Bemisia tabaci]CAH0392478.1 unnamed protein product [Bemisia tabaci]